MQLFRKKYLYNAQLPIYQSDNVKTFQCMNTETKDQRLLILHHLKELPPVDVEQFILQPIEAPTIQEPFSVYPFVECCSNIKKLNENDAMYVLKCLTQVKVSKPLYYVLAPQGICVSQVQGLLPQKSPTLFEIAINILDLPESLSEVQKSVVSKDGYEVCKAIKNGDDPSQYFQKYGWKDPKRDRISLIDDQFWIFKGRRKDQGQFSEQYGLAWSSDHNLCRFKYIDLSKVGLEEQFYEDFMKKVQCFKKAHENKLDLLQIYKYERDDKGIKIFTQIPNQGSLSEYLSTKRSGGRPVTQKSSIPLLQPLVQTMRNLLLFSLSIKSFGYLNIRNIFVHNGKLFLGDPLLITDSIEKKIRELKNGMDYFSPQLKENILLVDNLMKLNFEKMDVWFFGFLVHKILMLQVPLFDSTRKPILARDKFSPGMIDLITRCLSLTPSNRPSWMDINLRQLQKQIVIQQMVQQEENSKQVKQIKLGTRKQRISSRESFSRHRREESQQLFESNKKLLQQENTMMVMGDEFEKLNVDEKQLGQNQELSQQVNIHTPLKLRRFKLILKTILVMILYIFLFFRPFLWGSMDLLLNRGYYTTTTVQLLSASNQVISTSTILTSNPQYFMLNDVDFTTIYQDLHCLANNFNPIYNPDYQLNTFVQSGSFLALILIGWLVCVIICVTKSLALWKGGIGNHYHSKNIRKYFFTYAFHELSLAALLFGHFYIFQFFYFSMAKPCLGIKNFSGIQPFFDSSLYLFLGNTDQYLKTVFACLGILGIILLLSTCFYALGAKIDAKNAFSVFSIVFRYVPYVLFILFCRVGIFLILSPTAINDQNKILDALVSNSFIGVLGIIPEIFVLICLIFQVLFEYLFKWIQKKVLQSSQLAKFFNFSKGRGKTMPKPNKLQQSNDMSLENSKHHLTLQD